MFGKQFRNKWNRLPNYVQNSVITLPLVGTAVTVYNIEEAPYTKRKRVVFMPASVEKYLGESQFQEFVAQHKRHVLPKSDARSQLVFKVGSAIAQVAERPDFNWEYVVVDSKQQNAFVLPGGKVCVYTGLLKLMSSEASLAAVLAHEAGHAIARHGAENMTLSGILFGVFALIDIDLALFLQRISYFGLQQSFSRKCESEADYIGLHLMARACFDPRESPLFFEKLSSIDAKNPSWLSSYFSTHPPTLERVRDLRTKLPDVMHIYENSCGGIENSYKSIF